MVSVSALTLMAGWQEGHGPQKPVSAIFSEGFTETLGTGVYFQ